MQCASPEFRDCHGSILRDADCDLVTQSGVLGHRNLSRRHYVQAKKSRPQLYPCTRPQESRWLEPECLSVCDCDQPPQYKMEASLEIQYYPRGALGTSWLRQR